MSDRTEQQSSGRFVAWAALAVFSTVALTAHQTDDGGNKSGLSNAENNWVTSVTAISMSFAFLAMICHFIFRDNFVGKPLEVGVAFLLVLLWAGGLPVIMNPSNGLAATEDENGRFVIDNTNLYFSSWGAFVANMYILASFFKDHGLADVSAAPPKTPMWVLLFAASFVVMVSSSRYFKDNCGDSPDVGESTCRRTKYAIALGAIATVVSMVLSILSARAAAALGVELAISVILLIMYIFGVGYITFKTGPGTTIGNLYFSTWGAFLVTMVLTATCVREQMFGPITERDFDAPEPAASVTPVDSKV